MFSIINQLLIESHIEDSEKFLTVCILQIIFSLEKKGEPGYDKLGKVRPIMECCSQVLYNNYLPNCQLAIDESMIPFQGKSTVQQYMPLKPTKLGL